MTEKKTELYKNRSATQEFLFSPSEEAGRREAPDADSRTPATDWTAQFPDMLDRTSLIEAVGAGLGAAARLCAIAVAVDEEVDAPQDSPPICAAAITPVVAQWRAHDAVWGQTGGNRFVGVIPGLTGTEGERLAHRILAACQAAQAPPITIGLAVHPTLEFSRAQIVDNAHKALAHGGFFGPGTVTAFDAVSLNISGDRCYQAGDIDAAIDAFQQGLRLDPKDVNLHNSLGVCYGVREDYARALAAFETAIQLAPEAVMAVYNKGYLLLLQEQRDSALECFLAADALEPGVFEVVFHIGQIYMQMGAPDKARTYLKTATSANPRSGPAFKLLGECLERLDRTKAAVQAYKRSVKINPEDAEALSMLGRLYARRGESADVALVLCRQSVRLAPHDGRYHHRLGQVHLHQGRLDEALAAFEQAKQLGHASQAQIDDTQARMMAVKAS